MPAKYQTVIYNTRRSKIYWQHYLEVLAGESAHANICVYVTLTHRRLLVGKLGVLTTFAKHKISELRCKLSLFSRNDLQLARVVVYLSICCLHVLNICKCLSLMCNVRGSTDALARRLLSHLARDVTCGGSMATPWQHRRGLVWRRSMWRQRCTTPWSTGLYLCGGREDRCMGRWWWSLSGSLNSNTWLLQSTTYTLQLL